MRLLPAVLLAMLAAAPSAHAGQPAHDQGHSACLTTDIRTGTQFGAWGTIASTGPGDAMTITTPTGDVTVHGLGPASFWASKGVEAPHVGDEVGIDGYRIDCGEGEENIAMSIAFGSMVAGYELPVLKLRDPATGLPLWEQGPGKGPGHGHRGGRLG
jgi:hypothetical protein